MKITTLLENGACGAELGSAHGLSLYIETPKHKILFDMGPDEQFLSNAEKLGVDLKAVDLAILSHGHYDHGGGLEAFCKLNDTAKIYLRQGAFGDYVALEEDGDLRDIGLDPALHQYEAVGVLMQCVISVWIPHCINTPTASCSRVSSCGWTRSCSSSPMCRMLTAR